MALKPNLPYIRDETDTASGTNTGSPIRHIASDGGQSSEYNADVLNQCFSLRFSGLYAPYSYMCEPVKPAGKPLTTLQQLYKPHSNGSPGMFLVNGTDGTGTGTERGQNTIYGRIFYTGSGSITEISGSPSNAKIVVGNVDLSHYFIVPLISARNNAGQTVTEYWGDYKERYLTDYPDIIAISYYIYYKSDLSSTSRAASTNLKIMGSFMQSQNVPYAFTGSGANVTVFSYYSGTQQIILGGWLYYPAQMPTRSDIYVPGVGVYLPSFIPAGGLHSTHSPSIQQLKFEEGGVYSRGYICITASTAEKIIHSCGMWVCDTLNATQDAHGIYTTSDKVWMPEITAGGIPTGKGWTGGGVSDPTQSPIYNNWDIQNEKYPVGGEDAIGYAEIDINIPPSQEDDSDNKPLEEDTEELEPAAPEINGLGVFANYFAMSASSVLQLSDFLWNADETVIDDIINSLKLFGANPVNAIMSLRLYPFDVGTMAGSLDAEKIILGRVDTDVYGLKLTNSANAIIDLGKLYIAAHFGDFRDYSPYSAYNLYIPFIGTVSLNPNDYLNRMVSIKMIVDITTGKATAIIYANGIPMQYLDGMIAIEIPITSENMGQTANAIIGAVGSTAGALVTGNIVGAAMTAAAGAADVLFNDVSINKTGNVSASTSFFSPINAYVVISRPNAVIPSNYGHSRGYSCDYSAPLSSIVGYTVCVNVDTSGISGATDAERTQIKNLLEGGVYL